VGQRGGADLDNGGASWTRLTLSPTYPSSSSYTDDACGLPTGTYFTGTNLTWAQYTAALSTFAGQTVQIRWLLSTDTSQSGEGWYVDDISVTQVEVPGDCTTGSPAAQADLAVRVNDSVCYVLPGSPTTYTITVSNAGPDTVTGATVSDLFPAALSGVSWSCSGAGGGTCTGSGVGNISDSANLPSGSSVTYTATGTVSAGSLGLLVNTASVSAPAASATHKVLTTAPPTPTLSSYRSCATTSRAQAPRPGRSRWGEAARSGSVERKRAGGCRPVIRPGRQRSA